MGYIRAEEILPMEIVELIQQYAEGVNIYIPKRKESYSGWGQVNHAKENLCMRNKKIYQEYLEGSKVDELSRRYYLSEKSIWRILRKARFEF
ncbi:MAG: hypothetical protein LUF27_13775 [Lachnospiraceae bacterium]|nr:hypothetical protein [Lachnospiraceae bacterium]